MSLRPVCGNNRPQKLMEVAFAVGGKEALDLLQILNPELDLFWNVDNRVCEGQFEHPRHPMRRDAEASRG